jgi:hypothetical protein
MKAFIVDRYGSKDGAPGEMPDPEFQKDETRQRAVSFSQIFNPQPNPQFLYPCATCAACGSPRVFVSCCKTNSRSAVTAEVASSSLVVPAISSIEKWLPPREQKGTTPFPFLLPVLAEATLQASVAPN